VPVALAPNSIFFRFSTCINTAHLSAFREQFISFLPSLDVIRMVWSIPRRSVVYNDSEPSTSKSAAASAVSSVRAALSTLQPETTRWRKTFETYAKEVDGVKCVSLSLKPRMTLFLINLWPLFMQVLRPRVLRECHRSPGRRPDTANTIWDPV